MALDAHRTAELRSLAYHRRIADMLLERPSLVAPVVAKLAVLSATQPYARQWLSLLRGPLDALVEVLRADTQQARDLRQSTPFAGMLPPRERWAIWRQIH